LFRQRPQPPQDLTKIFLVNLKRCCVLAVALRALDIVYAEVPVHAVPPFRALGCRVEPGVEGSDALAARAAVLGRPVHLHNATELLAHEWGVAD
jgi:hypothetical protein